MTNTKHFALDLNQRIYIIENIIGGAGNVILTNIIDRGHEDGPERFELTEKGIIYVYNAITGRRITILFARVGQLYSRFGRKFESLPDRVQKSVKGYCMEWTYRGYNEV